MYRVAAFFVVGTLAIATVAVNELAGTERVVGDPYEVSYTYCKVTTYGTKGVNTCSQYATGYETRIKTEINGLFYNTTGYKVIR